MFSSSEMFSLSEILIVTCGCIIAPTTMYIMNNQTVQAIENQARWGEQEQRIERMTNQAKNDDREKANQVKCKERDRAIKRLTHELARLKEKEKEHKKEARQRLKPRQIQDYDGSQDNWIKWICDTKATLHDTGHRDIMESREAADNDHPLNSALWGTLLNACSGGSASSKITRHKDASDGHAAWKELLEWYDSESQQEAYYAATMKLKLEGVRLHPGGNISDYINNFESIYQKGSKIPRFNIRECDAKNTFSRNLLDPELAQLKMELQEGRAKMNLMDMEELRLNVLADKNDNKGSIRRVTEAQEPPQKRQQHSPPQDTNGALTTVHPNLKGILRIPPATWATLCKPHREWVLLYNRSARHQESPPPAPADITLGAPQDNGLNNTDIYRSNKPRRVRRISTPAPITTPLTPAPPSPPDDCNYTTEDSIGSIDESALFPPGSTELRTVQFHLHSEGGDDATTSNATTDQQNPGLRPRRNPTRRARAASFFSRARRLKMMQTTTHETSDSESDDSDTSHKRCSCFRKIRAIF
eukprot:jgi/Psemu1/58570/gm1.58570_g